MTLVLRVYLLRLMSESAAPAVLAIPAADWGGQTDAMKRAMAHKQPSRNQTFSFSSGVAAAPDHQVIIPAAVTESSSVNRTRRVVSLFKLCSEYGQPLGYPRHTSWLLTTETLTDLWVSRQGLRLTGNGYQVRGTSGFALRYTLSDKPRMRPVAKAWERELVDLVEKSKWRLPGASIYCKTDQSLGTYILSTTAPLNADRCSPDLSDDLLLLQRIVLPPSAFVGPLTSCAALSTRLYGVPWLARVARPVCALHSESTPSVHVKCEGHLSRPHMEQEHGAHSVLAYLSF